jgi:hypothetical protein
MNNTYKAYYYLINLLPSEKRLPSTHLLILYRPSLATPVQINTYLLVVI